MTSRPNVSLEAEGVSIAFGGVKALSEVSFRANPGEILGIIGPNGAGKSTLFSVITGFLRPQGGTVPAEARVVLDEFTAHGTPSQVREQLERWDSVADVTLVALPPGMAWDAVEAPLRAAAP